MLSCCTKGCMETEPKTAIVVGAGSRGSGYPYYAKLYPDRLKVSILFSGLRIRLQAALHLVVLLG